MFNNSLYIPSAASVQIIDNIAINTRLFRISFKGTGESSRINGDSFLPGQFVQVSVLGAGESPISICSSPTQKDYFELCIRNSGSVTGKLHMLSPGDEIGIRGPYGNSFPIEEAKGRDLMFIAGGIGLAPLRSLIQYVMDYRTDYGDVTIFYGARTKEDIVFLPDLAKWRNSERTNLYTSIDKPQTGWDGHVGVVTALLYEIRPFPASKAFVCGPPVMIHYTIQTLLDLGWNENDIIVTLERYMKCGVGKCGHCYIGGKYLCIDGPVFTYAQINKMKMSI